METIRIPSALEFLSIGDLIKAMAELADGSPPKIYTALFTTNTSLPAFRKRILETNPTSEVKELVDKMVPFTPPKKGKVILPNEIKVSSLRQAASGYQREIPTKPSRENLSKINYTQQIYSLIILAAQEPCQLLTNQAVRLLSSRLRNNNGLPKLWEGEKFDDGSYQCFEEMETWKIEKIVNEKSVAAKYYWLSQILSVMFEVSATETIAKNKSSREAAKVLTGLRGYGYSRFNVPLFLESGFRAALRHFFGSYLYILDIAKKEALSMEEFLPLSGIEAQHPPGCNSYVS